MPRPFLRAPVPVLAILVLLVGALLAGAGTAAAATGPRYVALGDSYAAGVGAPPDPASGACLRSPAGYPAVLAARVDASAFTSVACSGATTAQVLRHQIGAVTRDTRLVTITVGGNDTGFVPVLARCSTAATDSGCDQAVTAGERVARYVLPSALALVYGAVRWRAPQAKVLVLGYPHLFDENATCGTPLVPDAARRARINAGADVLNAAIADSARRWGATFVDVRPAFTGHGICGADPWLTPPGSPAAYHPTPTGYALGYVPAAQGRA
ncbi:SGNH family lipase [Pseudonocardia ailaonensis]|uniref:SGNH family lipase n=1 Tax=Pseudonocardia ailaonensis TaxID=367279 RepID=A0ABN2N375_9PSEU